MENLNQCPYKKVEEYLINENHVKFKKNLETFRFFDECIINGLSLLHTAAICGNATDCKLLLHKFPKLLDERDRNGNTALHWAARYGYADICEILITSGADVLANNNNNDSPLYIALECYNYQELSSRRHVLGAFFKEKTVADMVLGLLRSQYK